MSGFTIPKFARTASVTIFSQMTSFEEELIFRGDPQSHKAVQMSHTINLLLERLPVNGHGPALGCARYVAAVRVCLCDVLP